MVPDLVLRLGASLVIGLAKGLEGSVPLERAGGFSWGASPCYLLLRFIGRLDFRADGMWSGILLRFIVVVISLADGARLGSFQPLRLYPCGS